MSENFMERYACERISTEVQVTRRLKRTGHRYDRRFGSLYLVLDCETATLPCAIQYAEAQRKTIAIAKPLIYDLGWQIIDRTGRVHARKSYLINEIFNTPSIFNTGYYAEKRPAYLEKLSRGEIILTDWATAISDFVADMAEVVAVGAYNAMFDFKKAIPFTELYMSKLYSTTAGELNSWMEEQEAICHHLATGARRENPNPRGFEPDVFRFRGQCYKLFCLWGMACANLLDCDEYRSLCLENEWKTESGKFFKTSAEVTFRFISGDSDFIEAHTAIEDAIIESAMFALIYERETIARKKASKEPDYEPSPMLWEQGIKYFPFRMVGRYDHYELQMEQEDA